MSVFMEEYEKLASTTEVGIPNFVMNRPVAPTNALADVGLELEIEGENLPSAGKLARVSGKTSGAMWHTKADGSLRGEALEYVLNTPCKVEEVDDMVNGLYATFKANDTNLLLSNRCSTHVHVNMGGKKVNELTSAIALWTAFEEPLTLWAGEERVNNHFCLGAKDCNGGTVTSWRAFLRTGRQDFNDNLKYSALNILTLFRFGSIEYRVMNASEDPSRIIDWSKFVFQLTRYAGDQFANPATMAYSMSERGGREIFLDICERAGVSPDFVTGVMDTVPDIGSSVMQGFRRAQPIVAGFPWHDWYEECQKKYIEDPFGKKTKKKRGAILADAAEAFAMLDDDARPRPFFRFDAARAGEPAPPVPAAPGQPPRHQNIPDNFVWDGRDWVNPDYNAAEFNANRPDARVDYTSYSRVSERGLPMSPNRIRSGDLKFYGSDSLVAARAIVTKMNADGTLVHARADRRLIVDGLDLSNGYWYNMSDGFWNSRPSNGFIH